jgi:hypothetical protein
MKLIKDWPYLVHNKKMTYVEELLGFQIFLTPDLKKIPIKDTLLIKYPLEVFDKWTYLNETRKLSLKKSATLRGVDIKPDNYTMSLFKDNIRIDIFWKWDADNRILYMKSQSGNYIKSNKLQLLELELTTVLNIILDWYFDE